MGSISVRTKSAILKIPNLLLFFIYASSTTTTQIYPVTAIANQTNPTNLTPANHTKNSFSPDTSDPVAQKILQLFAASILAFGTLVADPYNPRNIKSTLFSMATCWYEIFITATKSD